MLFQYTCTWNRANYIICASFQLQWAWLHMSTPKNLSDTSENCRFAPIPFKVCGKRLVLLIFITITQCNWWVMIRTMYTPLPKTSKDELYFLMLPQLFGFYGSGTWQEKCKGTTTVPSAIQDAELSFDLCPCYERKRDVFSRLPQGDQQFLLKTWQKPCQEANRSSVISVSVTLCTSAAKPPAGFALLQYTEDHWCSIKQIYCLCWSETWARNPKASKMISCARA